MTEPIPRRIGKFEVEARMPPGGMSYVYRARHPNSALGLRAIKVLRRDLAVEEEYRIRFLREAEFGSGFDHENVVHIYDFGGGDDAESPPYMVMEFVEGSDLSAFTSGKRTCDLEEKLRIARQMAAALAHIHQMGVFHRDVKPQNFIRRESDGRVKLIDFGIAKQHDVLTVQTAMTVPGTVVGTPHYMAPEQTPRLSGEDEVTPLVDVYAYGIVLFELMAGREWTYQLPQDKKTPAMVAFRWICERPLDTQILRAADPPIPEAVSSLILRCTAKDPEARIQNFPAIVEEIDRIQSALTAPEDGRVSDSSSWLSRLGFQPRYLALAGVIAVLAVLVGLSLIVVWGPDDETAVAGSPALGESSEAGLAVPDLAAGLSPTTEPDPVSPTGIAEEPPVAPVPPVGPSPPPPAAPAVSTLAENAATGRVPTVVEVPDSNPPGTTTEPAAGDTAIPVPTGGEGDPAPVEVSASEMVARATDQVQPAYPDEARREGLAGTVVLRTWVDTDGRVTDVSRVTGDEVLARAAMDAVRQWRYRPWSPDGGDPVDVVTSVVVRFSIEEVAETASVTASPSAGDTPSAGNSPFSPCTEPRQVTLEAGQLVAFDTGTETFALYLSRIAPSLAADGGLTTALYWLRTDRPWWTRDRIDTGEIDDQLAEASDTLGPGNFIAFTLANGGRTRTAVGAADALEVALVGAGRTASTFMVCQGPPA